MKKISNRTKSLIIVGVAVIALLAVLGLLLMTPETTEEDQSMTEHHELFMALPEAMSHTEITNATGSYVLHYNDDQPLTVGGYEHIAADEGAIKNIKNRGAELIARKLVETDPSDLSLYGLADPAATVTLHSLKGESYTFSVGDMLSGEMGYYLLAHDTGYVYVVNSNQAEYYLKSAYYFLTKEVIAVEGTVNTIAIAGEGIDGALVLSAIEEYNDGIGNTYNYRVANHGNALAEPGIQNKYFNGLTALNCTQIMTLEATDDQLAAAGLKDPIKTLTFTVGNKDYTLKVGNLENNHYMVNVNDGDTIYGVHVDALPWVKATAGDLLCSKSGIPAIHDVLSFTVSGNGATYTYNITAAAENDVQISCGGKDLTYSNFKNFYRFISLTSGEDFVTEYDPNAEVVCTMSFKTADGDHVIRFLKAGVRRLYFEVDGVCNYTVSETYVDKILSDAQKAAAGESTSLMLQ